MFDEYDEGKVANFGQLSQVEQGSSDSHVSTPRSDLDKISLPLETGAIELVQDSSVTTLHTSMVIQTWEQR